MNEREIKNALIKSTMLGTEDHGIMTFFLHLEYDGGGQGAGGYALDDALRTGGKFIKRVGTAWGMSLIMEVLRVVGVGSWEELKGKHIRVKADHNKVYAIGHFLKDEWLDFADFWRASKEE